jgi:chromosome segregation ATPase
MIKSVTIKNYQGHKKTELEFHSNVNAIIGASDKGKSSIFRSLRWAIENKRSSNFRSNWGGDTIVKLVTDEGVVERIKTDKDNMYKLSDIEYKAIGQDVPNDVKDILNFKDLNIQGQHNNHFLLSETSGEVARYFNKIADLEIIDRSLKNVDSKHRKVKSEITFNESELLSEQEELKEYDWLEEARESFELIEEMESKLTRVNNKFNAIDSILSEIEELEENRIDIDIVQAEKDLKSIAELNFELSKLKNEYNSTEDFIEELVELEESKIDIDIVQAEKDLKIIEGLEDELESIEEQYEGVCELYKSIQSGNKHIENVINEIGGKEKELNKIMPDVCPVCDRAI